MEPVIEVKNLTKEYKKLKAVNDLSFEVQKGEILGLLGPNGSGKSTTINCILSLLKFSKGSIRIFGQEMKPNAYDIKRKIGVVFQEVAVFDELSVYDNIDYFCGLYVKDKKQRRQYIEDAIQLVGLEDFKKFLPKQLSGGLLRRLNIACGIAHKPSLIFLDEPTVAVDPQSRNNILDGIKTLRDQGATIVYTTHYMEEVELLCDRVIIIDKGQILASGTNDELKALANMEEKVTIETKHLRKEQFDYLQSLPNVLEATYQAHQLVIVYRQGNHNLSHLMEYFKQEQIQYDRMYSQRPTLNDVFLKLTGKELRD
ncbi:MAG: ABC transporter ATP-binding protein [Erysipelotrichaceae bacterium]|nr:ABC transporter ATP-binding protein [Erysipelotrichaceae bacterium]MCI9524160.1 ABC transporter ATP-binding protein [Erysipelotrichaceae bacterium]